MFRNFIQSYKKNRHKTKYWKMDKHKSVEYKNCKNITFNFPIHLLLQMTCKLILPSMHNCLVRSPHLQCSYTVIALQRDITSSPLSHLVDLFGFPRLRSIAIWSRVRALDVCQPMCGAGPFGKLWSGIPRCMLRIVEIQRLVWGIQWRGRRARPQTPC